MSRKPVVERAYELARSGRFRTVETIGQALRQEGYAMTYAELAGQDLRRRLREICRGEGDGSARPVERKLRRATRPRIADA